MAKKSNKSGKVGLNNFFEFIAGLYIALVENPMKFILDKLGLNYYWTKNKKVRHASKIHGWTKYQTEVVAFSLPAALTCPGMGLCGAACYAAALANFLKDDIFSLQMHNLALVYKFYLKGGVKAVADSLIANIDNKIRVIRIHDSGDFFSVWYLMAWINVAIRMPNVIFYGYTKSFHILAKAVKNVGIANWPKNFRISLSVGYAPNGETWHGGLYDEYLPELSELFNTCEVVWNNYDKNTPFNNEEEHAFMVGKINGAANSHKFYIGYHGNMNGWYPIWKMHERLSEEEGIYHC